MSAPGMFHLPLPSSGTPPVDEIIIKVHDTSDIEIGDLSMVACITGTGKTVKTQRATATWRYIKKVRPEVKYTIVHELIATSLHANKSPGKPLCVEFLCMCHLH